MADERDGTPGGDEIDRANAELIALAPTLAAENLTLSTRIKKLEEALGEAFYTLIYIFETTDDQKTAGAAKETADKIDTALSSSGGGE